MEGGEPNNLKSNEHFEKLIDELTISLIRAYSPGSTRVIRDFKPESTNGDPRLQFRIPL